MKVINVNLKENSYEILIKQDLIKEVVSKIRTIYEGKKLAVITDENVYSIYGMELKKTLSLGGFEPSFIVLEPGEKSKSLDTLNYIYSKLVEFNITRTDMIIAFGGGVVGDVTGFAASTYLRGIPYIQIPTTLLSQVDSSIGGKVAINLSVGKNLVGSFYQPKLVLIDTKVLATLPDRFIKDGMAEVIKYACIEDEEFFEFLNGIDINNFPAYFEDIVCKCCNIKKMYVEEDEKDTDIRMKLNFGHTIGHAIEKFFDYNKYTHGEAVAMGMYNITLKSEEINYTKEETSERIKEILIKFGLEYRLPEMDKEVIEKIIRNDKKNLSNKLNLIYLRKIGDANIVSKFILD